MDMINIFKAPTNVFNDMIYVNGQEIYHNGKKRYGIITNPEIKEFNDKYVSTDYKLMRGDYIYYDSMYWMVWNQVTVARTDSFKGIIRQAEHDVVFNLYYTGVTTDYLLKCPAVIQRTSDYTLRADEMMTTVDSEIHVFVQDTTSTRRIVDLMNKTDGQIILGERNYDITGISFEKKGYLDITCKMGTRNSASDYDNNIYWGIDGKQADWKNQFDLSFYNREGQAPVRPYVPDNYQTSLTLSLTSTAHTVETSGSIEATWTEEGNKDVYADFKGYNIRLLQGSNVIQMQVTNERSYIFDGLNIGTYKVEVFAIFGDNNTIVPVNAKVDIIDGEVPKPSPSDEITDVTLLAYDDSDSYGTLVWKREKNANKFAGLTLKQYRVEVYTTSMFGGDYRKEYWITNTERQDIRTGWYGEMGWYVTITSIFSDGSEMKPQRFEGKTITALPDTFNGAIW